MKYQKEYLEKISFPLGGIGSGCIGLSGNGRLIDWEIFNKPNKNTENGWSHFAVRCFDEKGVVDARVLVSDDLGDPAGRGGLYGHGANYFSMNGFEHFENSTFDGEFPIAKLCFTDEHFPGDVTLKAFNPFIPLDSKNSSIPAAFFEIEFENATDKELTYEAALSVCNPFENTVNTAEQNRLVLCNGKERENNVTVATDCENTHITNYWYRGWWGNFYKDNIRTFWSSWKNGEQLTCRDYTEMGWRDVGTVSGSVKVLPGERKTVRFVLSWSVPYCHNYWSPLKDEDGNDVRWKNYYATIFEDSIQSAEYSLKNWNYLLEKTEELKNCLYSSTIDESFKQAIGSGFSVLKSPTVYRLEDGSLYGFEGVNVNSGSCEGLCQHVWNYAYVCCYLFPDLERSIRDNEFKYGVLESGETVFRLPLPLDRKEFVNMFKNDGTKFRPALDGQMGDIIKAYREWKLSGDDEWLKGHWDTVKKVLDFTFSPENDQNWDENCDGVLEGRQHHTLDIDIFGASAWLQGFYLAALKCASEMAEHLSDSDAAVRYNELFEKGYKYTKENLFNGEYFVQKIDLTDKSPADKYDCCDLFWNPEYKEISYQIGNGCFIDQLCGQWHSILCGSGKPFDDEQAKKAVLSIYKNNYKTSMRNFSNPWRLFALNDEGGTVMCTYPEGTDKPKVPIAYCEEVMSGFEYEFAGLLLYYGFTEEAINVVKAVRARYNGKNRNPFNDIECGSNYARSMAAFALIPIISGFVADMPNRTMTFDPKVKADPFKTIWSVDSGWGEFIINGNELTVNVKSGEIVLEKLALPFISEVNSLNIDGENISDISFDNGALKLDGRKIAGNITLSFN